MSDRYNPLGVSGMIRPRPPQAPAPPRMTMTAYEQELDPYYDAAMEEETNKRGWLRPVQWVFDRLQTGQYVSANIANEIIDAFDRDEETKPEFINAIIEGVTGETKGSYENILRDRLQVGEKKLFQNAPEGSRRGQVDWADVIGFVADVGLDPMTYMGFGGVAKGAKNAASKFADDTVRITLRRLADEPAEIVMKTIGTTDIKKINQILAIADTNKGMGKLSKMGGDLGKFIDLTYRDALRTGMHRTQGDLLQQTTQRAAGLGMDDLMQPVMAGTAYEKAGTRYGARLFGSEKLLHEAGPIARGATDSWDKFARWFGQTNPTTSKMRGAVWGAFNRGPIGEMRRALGFRNPYQKYLRAQELENGIEMSRISSMDSLHEGLDPISGFSDDEITAVRDLMSQRQDAAKLITAGDGSATERMFGIKGIGAQQPGEIVADAKITKAADELNSLFLRINAEEGHWATRMGEQPADFREWYLPSRQRHTGQGGNVRQAQKYTLTEHFGREADLQKVLWNVDDKTATAMVQKDITGEVADFREILANRMLVHGKAKARWNLVEQMRELGINLKDSTDDVAQALQRGGRDIKALGLQNVDHAAFEGYVFDYDVAGIIKRALDVTGDEMNVFQRGMKTFANYWKGMVTATTGFHARNFISNTVTQFLRHGPRAFNFKEYMMSIAGVSQVISEGSRKSFLKAMNIDEGVMKKYLDMRVGNFTVRELAQEARRRGVISEATMGFDATDVAQKIAGNVGQPLRTGSRAVGNYVENIPRFQSFLIDYSDLAAKRPIRGLAGDQNVYDDGLRQWFRDSRVVNEAGDPVVMYHGSAGTSNVTELRDNRGLGGIFFTADKSEALRNANKAAKRTGDDPIVHEAFLRIESPNRRSLERGTSDIEGLDAQNFDGYIGDGFLKGGTGDEVAVFSADQIRPVSHGESMERSAKMSDEVIRAAEKPTMDWAGREAKKWFIDYSNLSEFEQKTMKSVIPFYSWIRNNLANQLSGIALYPDLYSLIPKIENVVAYEDPDYDEALVPQWLREAGAFPLKKTAEGMFRMFRPDFAHMDLNLIPLLWEEGRVMPRWNGEDLKDEIINATAPWIRRAADAIIQSDNPYQFFYKQELEPTAPAPYLMRLLASRPGVVPLIDGLFKMVGLENGAHIDEENGKLRIDSKMAILLEEFLPVLRQLDFAFYLPQTFGAGRNNQESALEQVIENFTGAEDEYEGAEQIMQMLSYYLGIKTRDQDLEAEKERLGRDIYYQATDALSAARREDPGRAVTRGSSTSARDDSIRRLGGQY